MKEILKTTEVPKNFVDRSAKIKQKTCFENSDNFFVAPNSMGLYYRYVEALQCSSLLLSILWMPKISALESGGLLFKSRRNYSV